MSKLWFAKFFLGIIGSTAIGKAYLHKIDNKYPSNQGLVRNEVNETSIIATNASKSTIDENNKPIFFNESFDLLPRYLLQELVPRQRNLPGNSFGVRPEGMFDYGPMGLVSDRRSEGAYVSAYDRRMRNPAWVVEHITAQSIMSNKGNRRLTHFKEDEQIPTRFRAKFSDYHLSGYDRGHMAPAADAKWNQEAMDATFYLSNICPQVGDGFNRDYWNELEILVRTIPKNPRFPSVRIATGPLYLPQKGSDGKWRVEYEVIGNPPNVAVPTHFFKIVFAEMSDDSRQVSPAVKLAPPSLSQFAFSSKPHNGIDREGESETNNIQAKQQRLYSRAAPISDQQKTGVVAIAAFVIPNKPIPRQKPLTDFEVSLEDVERSSGLEFVPNLASSQRRKLCDFIPCKLPVEGSKFS